MKLGRELLPAVDQLGSDNIKADISVADGEVFCLRLGLDTGPLSAPG
jgi:hypothetical protein